MAFWEGLFNNRREYESLFEEYKAYDGHAWKNKPLVASCLLTHHCNIHCRYCPFPIMPQKPKIRPSKEWLPLLGQLADLGVRRVSFSGGEPLLHSDLVSLIGRASELGLKKGIVSNGTRLTKEIISDMLCAGLDAITISLDTVSSDLYAEICGVSESMLPELLKTIIQIKNMDRCWIGINTVISKMNVRQIGRLLEFSHKNTIPIQFQFYNPYDGIKDQSPAKDDLQKSIEIIRQYKSYGALVLNSFAYLNAIEIFAQDRKFPANMNCFVPFVEIVVTPDLKIKACCTSTDVGDATTVPLSEIWQQQPFQAWRSKARSKSCTNCFLIYHDMIDEQ